MSEEPRDDAPVDEFAAKQAAGDPVPVETQQGVGNNPLPHQGGTGPVDDVRDPEGDSGQPQTSAELAERVESEDEEDYGLSEEDDAFYPRTETASNTQYEPDVTGTPETTTTTTTASDEDEE